MKRSLLLLCIFCGAVSAALIAFPDKYIPCATQGVALWAECVLPSLFPFMVVSGLLLKSGFAERASLPIRGALNKLHLPTYSAACLAISCLSGYPSGSKAVSEYARFANASPEQVTTVAALCSTSGPLFCVGTLGMKMLHSTILGVKIYAYHLISVIGVGLILGSFLKRGGNMLKRTEFKSNNVLYDSVYSATTAILVCGGYICFFYTLSHMAIDFKLLQPLVRLLTPILGKSNAEGLCKGLIEMTGGCLMLCSQCDKLSIALCGALVTLGGACILCQQLGYLKQAHVHTLPFIGCKLLQAMVCFVLLLVF